MEVMKMKPDEKERLAKVLIELIEDDNDVRGAIMACAFASPYIDVKY
jgi:hypothetical protein